jgi:putative transposase
MIPQLSLPEFLYDLRKLFEQFPEIIEKLWKGQLWNHSYYAETIGSVSEKNIRMYIEKQTKAY